MLFLALVFLSFLPSNAQAACSNPDGEEGALIYNGDQHVMQYCSGTAWVGMAGNATGTSVGTLTANKWCRAASSGATIDCIYDSSTGVAGSDKMIQFNDGGAALGGAAQLFWDKASNSLRIGSDISTTSALAVTGASAVISPITVYGNSTDTRIRINNNTAVSASNLSGIDLAAMSSSQVRTAALIQAGLSDTTDATRTGFLSLNLVNGGTISSALYIAGNKVGIGSTAPTTKLHVDVGTAANDGLRLSSTDSGSLYLRRNSAQSWQLGTFDSAADLSLLTNGTERIRLLSNGNIGINTNNPTSALQMKNAGGVSNGLSLVSTGASQPSINLSAGTASPDSGMLVFGDGTGWKFHFGRGSDNGNTKFVTLQDNGRVGIGTTAPAETLHVAGNIKADRVKSRASVIALYLSQCGGNCSSYHGLNTWYNVSNMNYSWTTSMNTNTSLFSTDGKGLITVNEAGVYQVTLTSLMYPTSTVSWISHLCPFINGSATCPATGDGQPFYGYYPGGYWNSLRSDFYMELSAGTTIGFGYYIYAAMTYWANDGSTRLIVSRVN